jgi:uncharacterized membrane protein YkvI
MITLIIIVALVIMAFSGHSFYKEYYNYRHGIFIEKAKRRLTINSCLFMVAAAMIVEYSGVIKLENQHELLFWGFLLMLMVAIIWMAWIDLKEGLKDVEKKAMEDMVRLIHEIKQEEKNKNKDDPFHKDLPIQ